MAFTPRTTCPDVSDKHWIVSKHGGYNRCIQCNSTYHSALPNCVGYAWGRFLEVLGGTDCNLSTSNAENWWGNTSDGYQRGQTPQVGAVICWRKGRAGDGTDGAGHVGIVEAVNADGTIVTSESGYGNSWASRFWTKTRSNSNGNWGQSSSYTFQGFIYNPGGGSNGTAARDAFVEEALKHVGENHTWTWNTYGKSDIEWCAAFVSAVAKTTGCLGKCIYHTAGAGSHAREGVKHNMGKFYKGPAQGGSHRPSVGDLILFRRAQYPDQDQYYSNHIGIVVEVSEMDVFTVEGNTGTNDKYTSTVKKKSYTVSTSTIGGYYSPDWTLAGDSVINEGYVTSELYETATTKKDMTVREIGYLDSDYKPSIKSSDIKLSAINYTGVLAAYFKILAPTSYSGDSTADTSQLEGNCKICVDYLIDKGLNAAAACGIAGNIYHESSFNTAAVGDNGTSFGICQWHNQRATAMKQMAGSNWASNLSGQLDYLWTELNTSEYKSTLLASLLSVANNEIGCKESADMFVRKFERPSNVDVKTIQRQATAVGYFNKVVIMSVSPSGPNSGNVVTQSGQSAPVVKTVEIPSSVKQTGMIRNYTSYTDFYSRWSRNTIQRTLADIWGAAGKPSSRNIATINGLYLVAMSSVFGTTGDIVTIELENGDSFNAILGDSKGSDAGSQWGHLLGGKADIIEWEAVGTTKGNEPQQGPRKIELGTWDGQKVKRVHNRGTWLR